MRAISLRHLDAVFIGHYEMIAWTSLKLVLLKCVNTRPKRLGDSPNKPARGAEVTSYETLELVTEISKVLAKRDCYKISVWEVVEPSIFKNL